MPWGIPEQVAHLQKLLASGVLGTYKSFEVTEIIGFLPQRAPTNFFSLLVAEAGVPPQLLPGSPPFLNDQPLPLRGTDWKFGIARYRISLHQAIDALMHYEKAAQWCPGGKPLKLGQMRSATPQFVPADSSETHPWNGVLKNNFFEGSHVLELCDETKSDVGFLLRSPELLSDFTALIQPFAQLGIDGLSDRLGNVLLQIPITIISLGMRGSATGDVTLHPGWHPLATPRPLRVSFERYRDGTVDDFASGTVHAAAFAFPLKSPSGGPRYVVWDDTNEVVVAASAPTAFITSISVGFNFDGQPVGQRVFTVPNGDGPQQVELAQDDARQIIGNPPHGDPREPWRSRRVFGESLARLQDRKEFVQYGGPNGPNRQRALADLRWLIDKHGRGGAWLWDPYLSADDVLHTLFYCRHRGADLRALSAAQEPRESRLPAPNKAVQRLRTFSKWAERRLTSGRLGEWLEPKSPPLNWSQRQARSIEIHKGNCEGLKLEFRVRNGGQGWPFHDRFLILPGVEPGEAKAWSLGTSVNSLGNEHHILQMAANGERIRLAFLELWNQLSGAEHQVWSAL